MMNPN